MNFLVPKELLETIVQYLGGRPFVEVQQIIQGIGQCQVDPKDVEAAKKLEAALGKKEPEKKVT